jgi:hypothetical protein
MCKIRGAFAVEYFYLPGARVLAEKKSSTSPFYRRGKNMKAHVLGGLVSARLNLAPPASAVLFRNSHFYIWGAGCKTHSKLSFGDVVLTAERNAEPSLVR